MKQLTKDKLQLKLDVLDISNNKIDEIDDVIFN